MLTQDQRDAAIAENLNKLQGQWNFDKAERNDASRVVLFEDSIYPSLFIEKDIVPSLGTKQLADVTPGDVLSC